MSKCRMHKSRERIFMQTINEEISKKRVDLKYGNIESFLSYRHATQQTRFPQFFEVLCEEDKPKALLDIVKYVFCKPDCSQKFKMLVFVAVNDKNKLINYLDQELGHLCPPIASTPQLDSDSGGSIIAIQEQIAKSLQHGILFLTQFDFLDTNHRIEGLCLLSLLI
jgi:hypothetical protein